MSGVPQLIVNKLQPDKPTEVRMTYNFEYGEWEVLLRNRQIKPPLKIKEWFYWGYGKAFVLEDAVCLAFNEAAKRGYYK